MTRPLLVRQISANWAGLCQCQRSRGIRPQNRNQPLVRHASPGPGERRCSIWPGPPLPFFPGWPTIQPVRLARLALAQRRPSPSRPSNWAGLLRGFHRRPSFWMRQEAFLRPADAPGRASWRANRESLPRLRMGIADRRANPPLRVAQPLLPGPRLASFPPRPLPSPVDAPGAAIGGE